MRNFLLVVGALVMGLVVGSWQPRGEVLRLRDEIDGYRAKVRACNRGTAAEGIRELLRAEAPAEEEPRREGRRRSKPRAEVEAPSEAPVAEAPAEAGAPSPAEAADAAAAALDARAAQARAALLEQADPDDAQLAAVDAAIDEMNRQLKAQVDAFVETALGSGDFDRRELMDFAAESLDVVIEADDRIRDALGPEAYAAVDDQAVDPFSYVSGDTLSGLARLEELAPTPDAE